MQNKYSTYETDCKCSKIFNPENWKKRVICELVLPLCDQYNFSLHWHLVPLSLKLYSKDNKSTERHILAPGGKKTLTIKREKKLADHNFILTSYTEQSHNGRNNRITNTNSNKPTHVHQPTQINLTSNTKTKQQTKSS